jgi:uncharacterized protein YbaA (DUF1428 family)
MSFIDCSVIPVPKKNLAAYRQIHRLMRKVWMDCGALHYQEFLADDAKPGKQTSFPQSVKLKARETVVVGIITYRSRSHRDRINAIAMKDPRLASIMDPKSMPFDGTRMYMGGFKALGDR